MRNTLWIYIWLSYYSHTRENELLPFAIKPARTTGTVRRSPISVWCHYCNWSFKLLLVASPSSNWLPNRKNVMQSPSKRWFFLVTRRLCYFLPLCDRVTTHPENSLNSFLKRARYSIAHFSKHSESDPVCRYSCIIHKHLVAFMLALPVVCAV